MKIVKTFEEFINESQLNEDAKDKISKVDMEKITSVLNKFKDQNLDSGEYWKELYDPQQTHAIYGLKSKDDVNAIKKMLTNLGAKKFRVVNNILCFDATNMAKLNENDTLNEKRFEVE
jgi:hypothetical protein